MNYTINTYYFPNGRVNNTINNILHLFIHVVSVKVDGNTDIRSNHGITMIT